LQTVTYNLGKITVLIMTFHLSLIWRKKVGGNLPLTEIILLGFRLTDWQPHVAKHIHNYK